jgi:hypothetical protein
MNSIDRAPREPSRMSRRRFLRQGVLAGVGLTVLLSGCGAGNAQPSAVPVAM